MNDSGVFGDNILTYISHHIGKFISRSNARSSSWKHKLLFDRQHLPRSIFRRLAYRRDGSTRPALQSWLAPELGMTNISGKSETDKPWLNTCRMAHRALATFPETSDLHRINVVTDNISHSSLFGGVATSLILAALWADRVKADLRIITRTQKPDQTSLGIVLAANGIEFTRPVDFRFCPHIGGREISVGPNDIFLTTSWWTTRCLLNTVPPDRIVFLLNEDEETLFPKSKKYIKTNSTLNEPIRNVVINSHLLYSHITEGADAAPGLSQKVLTFQPAFTHIPRSFEKQSKKRKLLLYVQPQSSGVNINNCIDIIDAAVKNSLLNKNDWEIYFIGQESREVIFHEDLDVHLRKPMHWAEYIHFIRKMDAGISFTNTSFPTSLPLDLASIGVPVMTNYLSEHKDNVPYSDNIISVPSTKEDMLDGLRRLIDLSGDLPRCAAQMRSDHIQRSWEETFAPTLAALEAAWPK